MTTFRCGCGKPATFRTPSGQPKCDQHWREFVTLAGAGSALAAGADPGSAVGTGLASGNWATAMRDDQLNAARRREKLAATTGFWPRLKVRLFG